MIVDEVSILRGEVFDKVEYVARKVRKSDPPFGGTQPVLRR